MPYIPPWENIVEKKICRVSGQEFSVTNKDLEFYDKVSPIFGGKKYSIPSPTLCPDERQKRRLAFRNERKLYKRKCDATGKELISNYHPDVLFPIFSREYWLSDKYNPTDYGMDFDFNKSFFEQFQSLSNITPRFHIQQQDPIENSEYSNCVSNCRSCYLTFDSDFNEKCYYCNKIHRCKDCLECSFLTSSEQCFECFQCEKSHGLHFSNYCINCSDSWFIDSCIGCRDCIYCCNLVNKQYCFMNEQLTKAEYQEKLTLIAQDQKIASRRDVFQSFLRKNPKKFIHGTQIENSTGDDLYNVKNVKSSFVIMESEDCAYSDLLIQAKNCMDVSSFGDNMAWAYEVCSGWLNSQNCCFGVTIVLNSRNLLYCSIAYSSQNCFWCISLKQKAENMILNKAYSTQEYETLCWKIINHMQSTGEWGEFFPHELSPFWYNETVAQEYFPMTAEEVRAKGWNWYEGENKNTYIWNHYTPLPISQYDERVVWFDAATQHINECLNWIIQCEVTWKPFKVIKQELAFYIENSIPIPTKHPDQRHIERMNLRNPRKLYERTCAECQKEITTTYAPERPEKVVCEECYHKIVY